MSTLRGLLQRVGLVSVTAGLSALAVSACGGPTAEPARPRGGAVTITYAGWSLSGNYAEFGDRALADFTSRTGIAVQVLPRFADMQERLPQFESWLDERASTPDVYEGAIADMGALADDMIDLGPALGQDARAHEPGIIGNYTFGGRLLAMPLFTDVGVLFYRSDLLAKYRFIKPPETWGELERMAEVIQAGERKAGNADFWGFVWEGAATEGFSCNALEWQASSGGGTVIEPNGTISVDNPAAIRAFDRARGWVGTISPSGVAAYLQGDVQNLWHSGNAAFMRSWPFAYRRSQMSDSPIKGRVGVTLLPSGGARHVGVLGGWQLSVSKYSAHPGEAVELVRFLTGRQAQKRRALLYSWMPTISDLYDDPDVLAANPFLDTMRGKLLAATVARPTVVAGRKYQEVAHAYILAVHSVVTGERSGTDAMHALERRLVEVTGFRTGAPLSGATAP